MPSERYYEIERVIRDSDAAISVAQERLVDRCGLEEYSSLAVCENGEELWGKALQKALDEHEIVVIPPRDMAYCIEEPVEVPSNRRIEAFGATIRLARNVTTLMLRSSMAQDGTLKPIATVERSTNIAIRGGVWCDNSEERRGYGRSGTFSEAPREIGSFFGVSTLFFFSNADLVSVTDATFVNCGAFAVQCGDGDCFLFERIAFRHCFADGIHLNGNMSRIHLKDIRGSVCDDLVALNAFDWLNSTVAFGPQSFIICEDLELIPENGRGYPAIRIQPARRRYADGTIADCSVSDLVFRHVRGITTFKLYLQTPPYAIGTDPEPCEVGSGGGIFFEDIAIDLESPIDCFGPYAESEAIRGHFGAFEVGSNIDTIDFKDIEIVFHCDKYPLSHLMTVGPKSAFFPGKDGEGGTEVFDPYVECTVGRVTLGNVRCHGKVPDELVHETVFDDVDKDGRSSGRGRVGALVMA